MSAVGFKVRVDKGVVDAALSELGCMSDEQCNNHFNQFTCSYCREKAAAAIRACINLLKQRRSL